MRRENKCMPVIRTNHETMPIAIVARPSPEQAEAQLRFEQLKPAAARPFDSLLQLVHQILCLIGDPPLFLLLSLILHFHRHPR